MPDTIGFIGLGLMGRPMAHNLLKRGFPLVVHSRSPAPVDELVAAGAQRADSPAAVARKATRILSDKLQASREVWQGHRLVAAIEGQTISSAAVQRPQTTRAS